MTDKVSEAPNSKDEGISPGKLTDYINGFVDKLIAGGKAGEQAERTNAEIAKNSDGTSGTAEIKVQDTDHSTSVTPAVFAAALKAGGIKLDPGSKYENEFQQYLADKFESAAKAVEDLPMGALAAEAHKGVTAHLKINKFLKANEMAEVARPVSENGVIMSVVTKMNANFDGRGTATKLALPDGKEVDAVALKQTEEFKINGTPVYKIFDKDGSAVYVAPHAKAFASDKELNEFVASHTPKGSGKGSSLTLTLPMASKEKIVELKDIHGMNLGDGLGVTQATLQQNTYLDEHGLTMETGFTMGADRSYSRFGIIKEPYVIWRTQSGKAEPLQLDHIQREHFMRPPKEKIKANK